LSLPYDTAPEKHAEKLRGVGNSSGDENGSDSMKYWESSLTRHFDTATTFLAAIKF
jgi:hypothetical protein